MARLLERVSDPVLADGEHRAVRRARSLHPWAWWAWAAGTAAALSLTTNPLLVVLVVAALALVVATRRSDAPWARSTGTYLVIALVVIAVRMVFQILMGSRRSGTVLFTLPQVPLPSWAAGVSLGGPVSAEALLSTLYESLSLAAVLLCFGAANSLANPRSTLKSVPAALHDVSVAVVIAISVFPQVIASVHRVRRARRLRGSTVRGPRALAGIVIPVLEDAVEASMHLARGMESRGYGRTRDDRRVRRGTTALLVVSLMALTVGVYLVLTDPQGFLAGDAACRPGTWCHLLTGGGSGRRLGIAVVALALVGTVAGLRSTGRRLGVTRYRPDPWTWRATLTALCGVGALALTIWAGQVSPDDVRVTVPPLTWPPLTPLMLVIAAVVAAPTWLGDPR